MQAAVQLGLCGVSSVGGGLGALRDMSREMSRVWRISLAMQRRSGACAGMRVRHRRIGACACHYMAAADAQLARACRVWCSSKLMSACLVCRRAKLRQGGEAAHAGWLSQAGFVAEQGCRMLVRCA